MENGLVECPKPPVWVKLACGTYAVVGYLMVQVFMRLDHEHDMLQRMLGMSPSGKMICLAWAIGLVTFFLSVYRSYIGSGRWRWGVLCLSFALVCPMSIVGSIALAIPASLLFLPSCNAWYETARDYRLRAGRWRSRGCGCAIALFLPLMLGGSLALLMVAGLLRPQD